MEKEGWQQNDHEIKQKLEVRNERKEINGK
jgi:hypothetical protein